MTINSSANNAVNRGFDSLIGGSLISAGTSLVDNIITNATNKNIADQNYEQQEKLFEYNKALQDRLFEREDTSYQRTAQDMRSAGLNPLSMQGTNEAGEAIAQTAPQNNFQFQPGANNIFNAIQSFAQLKSTFDNLETNRLQRDSLALENDKKRYELLLDGLKKGIKINFGGENEFDDEIFDKWLSTEYKKLDELSLQQDYNIRNMQHDIDSNRYPSDTNFERTITAIVDWLSGDRSKQAWDKLKKQYPLLQLFEMYFQDFMTPKYEVTR